MVCEVDCEFQQNDAREGKHMQIPAQNHQKYVQIMQKQALFRL